MKNLFLVLAFSILLYSCGGNERGNKTSSNSKCSDMKAYKAGIKAGKDNANMIADCDYFWQMDNDGEMSKSCYCKGYNSIEKSF